MKKSGSIITKLGWEIADGNDSRSFGTSLRGEFPKQFTLRDIEAVLGQPSIQNSPDDKVTKEWIIIFDDGTVATIYDYKGDPTPHIGGRNKEAVARVFQIFNLE